MALCSHAACGARPIVLVGGGTALIGDPAEEDGTMAALLMTRKEINESANP